MSLSEKKVIDRVEIVNDWNIQVREAIIILKDGQEIAKNFHRWTFMPGSDLSAMPANVQAIAAAAWTPEVIANYQAFLAEQEAKRAQQGAQA